jgi:hypothetical protein
VCHAVQAPEHGRPGDGAICPGLRDGTDGFEMNTSVHLDGNPAELPLSEQIS